jgi:hypothetical protein
MTLTEIMQKIAELSGADRAILHRELQEMLCKRDVEEASPELRSQLSQECRPGDERGVPIEDAMEPPKPEN